MEKNALSSGLMTPLMMAVELCKVTILKQLLSAHADPNVCATDDGLSALHIAASKGFSQFVTALLNAGANVNALYVGCKTPLDCALSDKHAYVASQLRSAGGKEFKEILATATETHPSEAASAAQ